MGGLKTTEPGWATRGWLRASASREIAATPAQVWEIASDAARWTDWFTTYDEFETIDDKTLGIDTRFRIREWRLTYEGVVNEWEPERRIGMTHTTSSFSWMLTSYADQLEIEPTGEGCTVTFSGRFSLNLLGWLIAPYSLGQTIGLMWAEFHSAVKGLERVVMATTNPELTQ